MIDRLRAAYTPNRRRAIRDGLILAGVLLTVAQLAVAATGASDAIHYWSTPIANLYQGFVLGGQVGYGYSPAFAQLISPLTFLPWELFRVVWVLISLACLAWLATPVPRFWLAPFVLLCLPEVINGNIYLPTAVAVAVGLRYPAAWAFPLLTKVTPGLGLAWFAVRREWLAFTIALGATAVVALVSWMLVPGLWPQWIDMLWSHRGAGSVTVLPQPPLLVRIPIAFAVVIWGARTDRRWTIPLAIVIGLPDIVLTSFTIMAAVPRLQRLGPLPERETQPKAGSLPAKAVAAAS